MHTLKHLALMLPIAAALTQQIAFAESDRHITYMQQHQELIDRDQKPVNEAVAKQRDVDATITAQVRAEFAAETQLQNTAIEVNTRQQVVTLSGSVPSQQQKQRAEAVVNGQEKIKGLNNQLRVER